MKSKNTSMEKDVSPVLVLKEVFSGASHEKVVRLQRFTGEVREGQMIEIQLDDRHDPREAIAVILGLHEPENGIVTFGGKDWMGSDYSRHFRMRSQIGRVFFGPAWIQSLTVGENIRLSPLHQGKKIRETQERIDVWTERLSGPFVSQVRRALNRRPAFVDAPILQIGQWIRAVSNDPKLLVLERPLNLLPDEVRSNVRAAIDELRQSQVGILWFADGRDTEELGVSKVDTDWQVLGNVLTNTKAA